MKKSILNLVGAQELSKNEQKSLNGGGGMFEDIIACLDKGCVFSRTPIPGWTRGCLSINDIWCNS